MKSYLPIIIAIVLVSCNGDDPDPARNSIVHMSGFITTSTGSPLASYWNNGAYTSLVADSAYSNVNSMFVDGSTAVLGGYNVTPTPPSEVFIWRDGTRSRVEDAWGTGPLLAVSHSALFAVYHSSSLATWVLNKNHASQPLLDTAAEYWPTDLAVLGDDMYISGVAQGDEFSSDVPAYYRDQYAQYWRNDQLIFKERNRSFAWSIFIRDGDIYLGGNLYPSTTENRIACYWKNGQRVDLTDGSEDAVVSAIFVHGGSVYASGTIGNHACYWKDGLIISLPHGSIRSGGNSISVSGGDVHVAGYDDGYPAYWKNEVKQAFEHQNKRGEIRFIAVGSD